MLGIWTLRGNSSTARFGWVAADAAMRCRIRWLSWLHIDEWEHKIASHLGLIDPDRNVPPPIGHGSQAVGRLRPIQSATTPQGDT